MMRRAYLLRDIIMGMLLLGLISKKKSPLFIYSRRQTKIRRPQPPDGVVFNPIYIKEDLGTQQRSLQNYLVQ